MNQRKQQDRTPARGGDFCRSRLTHTFDSIIEPQSLRLVPQGLVSSGGGSWPRTYQSGILPVFFNSTAAFCRRFCKCSYIAVILSESPDAFDSPLFSPDNSVCS